MIIPMLAVNANPDAIAYPIDVQPKLDGFRCIAYRAGGRVVLQSRRGNPLSVPHVEKALARWLPPGVVLDGELYAHGSSFQNVQRLVRCDRRHQLALHVFDLVEAGNWRARRARLEALTKVPQHVAIVPTVTVTNEAAMWAQYERILADGYEGVILRRPSASYAGGRVAGLAKLKPFDDGEYEVVGVRDGSGKARGCAVFTCATTAGKRFDVVPRGSDDDRRTWFAERAVMVGRMLTVRHFGLTDGGIPRSPIGVGFRLAVDLPPRPVRGMTDVAALMAEKRISVRAWAARANTTRTTIARAISDVDSVALGTVRRILAVAGFDMSVL